MQGQLLHNEKLSKYTSWRVGGVADCLYIPYDKKDLIAFVKTLPETESLLWIGLGSNLLVRDGGIRGTVINTKGRLKTLRLLDENHVYVEAGVPCAHVAKFCAEQGLIGAEFLAGIPGTMGGALKMNAGAFGGETWNCVETVEMLNRYGDVFVKSKADFNVSYRAVKSKNVATCAEWFLASTLHLEKGDVVASQQKIKTLLEKRNQSQPTNQPSCGSVFKNPQNHHAAKLIEESGLKGFCIGGACVSEKHANFIVNTGNASALEIEALIYHVQQVVQQKHNILLQTEVCIVGEKENCLKQSKRILHANEFGKVAVLMGGDAAERVISLNSGHAVFNALRIQGINVIAVDVKDNAIDSLANLKIDRVFNCIHGRGGEDGKLQAILEILKIPYTGSAVMASALSMDKLRTKLCWRGAGLTTPDWFVLKQESDVDACIEKLGLPMIVKPAQEGSSVGMSKACSRDELLQAFHLAAQFNCDVYAESWVVGKEYTVGILNGEALPVIGLETPNAFYDYQAKYHSTSTQYHCPSNLNDEQEKALQTLALTACDIIGISGWARVDVFIDENNQAQLIEVNTVPGMTDHSLVPMAAKQAGIDFEELVWRILETSVA